jgi:hypothetical protein
MAITYTWSVTGLMVQDEGDLDKVAVMSNFSISGTDGQYTGQVSYSVNLLSADAQNFTPYNEITQTQALEWTKDALGVDRVAAMEGEVSAQIAKAAIPTPQPAPLPWA